MKWSVIIPTLWKPDSFPKLLQELEGNDSVDEILIIDNAPNNRPKIALGKKVNRLEQQSNIYVNPAWNLGAEMARNEYICICNDDVLFDSAEIFGFLKSNYTKGMIGIHPDSFNPDTWNSGIPVLSNEIHITQMWACLFFLRKSKYRPIPTELKVWWGDAWLAWHTRPSFSLITAVRTKHSESVSSPEFQSILDKDTRLWNESLKPLALRMRESNSYWINRIKNGVRRRINHFKS